MDSGSSLKSVVTAMLVGAAILLAQSPYEPAAVSVGNLQPPANSIASGIAVLDLSLDATGTLSSVTVLRDLPPLTAAAQSAVALWKFRPSVPGTDGQPSDLLVAFVLTPNVSFPTHPKFAPLVPKARSRSGYVPPGIASVTYAQYPVNSVISGSVVVQVTVGPNGDPHDWQVVRALDPCTPFALDAAKKWRFRPAILDGQPVASNVAIDFLFRPPLN
jgi:TonB family protein